MENFNKEYLKEKPLTERVFHEYCDRWVLERLDERKAHIPRFVLDVGGGDGRLTRKLSGMGWKVYYNDVSVSLCQSFRERTKGQIEVIQGDVREIEIPDDVDSVVFSFGVLNFTHLKVLDRFKKKLILGWVSNNNSLEWLIKHGNGDITDYEEISKEQYGEVIRGSIRNYSYAELKEVFDEVIPFPTYLFLPDWKKEFKKRVYKKLITLDLMFPNKELCSGFLVIRDRRKP